MVNANLLAESSSLNNFRFRQVEKQYLEHGAPKTQNVAQKCSSAKVDTSTQDVNCDDSIVSDIVKARKIIQLSLASVGGDNQVTANDSNLIQALQDRVSKLEQTVQDLTQLVKTLTLNQNKTPVKSAPAPKAAPKLAAADDDDDDVDLFGSGDEDDAAADELRQKRVEAYNQKKSKKPAVIAKSSIILDVKPWDDETNMDEMQALVRTIVMDGLVWGAAKYVPLAYGIKKLQIVCVIEDDKVSVEELTEKIESFENHVQSVDIAAFNKV